MKFTCGFKETVFLTEGKPIDLDIYTKMGFFLSFQDYIIIQDIYSSDEGIYILDKKTLNLIKKTGKIGRGPGEIGRYGDIYTDELNHCFYVADFGKNKIWKYQIDSLISEPDYKPNDCFDFRFVAGMWPMDFIVKNDTLYFLSDLDYFMTKVIDKDSVEFISKSKKEILELDNIKDVKGEFYTRITVHPNKSKYAFAFMYADKISITDNNFKPIDSANGKGKIIISKDKFKDICYYVNIKSDEKYLYAGYMKKPILREDPKYGNHIANYPQTIRIFSWTGEAIAELKCDDPFSDFYVDRDNNRVILYLINKEKPVHVYKFNFNEILN